MRLDIGEMLEPALHWWDEFWYAIGIWWGGWRIQHWWWAWHPIFVDGKIVWGEWVVRRYNTKLERYVDRYRRVPPLGFGKWTYFIEPSTVWWHDYSPFLKLFYGENPGRSEAQWRRDTFVDPKALRRTA